MRLDWFLPFRRKSKWGRLRQLLHTVGESWHSSPGRRVVQAVCFVVFCWLFFYVCWPYSARPASATRGWIPVEVDAATGEAVVEADESARPVFGRGDVVHVVDDAERETRVRSNPDRGDAPRRFRVVDIQGTRVRLAPDGRWPAEQLELLAASVGPWSIHESPPGEWPDHYAENLRTKERLPADTFLAIDPLVSLSTAIASRSWIWSLSFAAAILAVCVAIPRGFCGYLCPLGTLIDLFDWSIARRTKRFHVADDGWWVHVKYYLLLGTLVAAACGVLVSGFVAAIPVLTRGFLFLFSPLATGLARGWHQAPPVTSGQVLSLLLFAGVLCLGFLKPRFWCKYVCPSGAVFSLGNVFRVSERKVESSCIHCNKCVEICPFDAIKADFTTRTTDCTLCQTCGGVCPTQAIKFVDRWNMVSLKTIDDPPTGETLLGRRGFLAASVGLAAGTAGGVGAAAALTALGASPPSTAAPNGAKPPPSPAQAHGPPVRPPGSVPEPQFLQMCIRCGECFQVCPNNVLQPQGFSQGWNGLWTPQVVADWAGCESSCNACGQVCPTGAIRALPLEEKKVCRIGLAVVDVETCLPFSGREACQLCVDECNAAGYRAIEFTRAGTEMDESGKPVEGSGFLAPVVLPELCVGCGLCQTRCYGINVAEKRLLSRSAIVVEAGLGKEDRLMSGSYIDLRRHEADRRAAKQRAQGPSESGNDYLPDFID